MPPLSFVPDLPPLRIERRAPGSLGAVEVAAWRALTRRALEPSPFADPDCVLPAAQHRAAGRELFLLLAWDAAAGRQAPVLRGVLPVPRAAGLIAGLARPRTRPGIASPPLVEADFAPRTLAALLADLACGPHAPRHLDLADVAPDGPLAGALHEAAGPLGLRITSVPRDLPTPLATAARDTAVVHLGEPRAVREGVERFLALEARHVRPCLLDDPTGTTALRVATRRLAARHLCRVTLVRRAGVLVGATVSVRAGGREVVWHRTGLLPEGMAGPAGNLRLHLVSGGLSGFGGRRPGRTPDDFRRRAA